MALNIFRPFPNNSLIRAKNWFVTNGTANFGRNSRPSPEAIPNVPVRRNRNGPFYLNYDRNVWNLWQNGKHPDFSSDQFRYVYAYYY